MRSFRSFTIVDPTEIKHVFSVGDHIDVLPEDGNDEMWVATIDAIRGSDPENVWLRVRWYYHPSEISKAVSNLHDHAKYFASKERVESNHYDTIPSISCNGHASISRFRENDLEQEPLHPNTMFWRLSFDILRKQPPRFSPNCVCREPYGPDMHVMHRCGTCKKWFHTNCLKAMRKVDRANHSIAPHRRGMHPNKTPKLSKKQLNAIDAVHTIAKLPIVRGLKYGVVGNASFVLQAQKLLQELQSSDNPSSTFLPDNWTDQAGLSEKMELPYEESWFICPNCGISI